MAALQAMKRFLRSISMSKKKQNIPIAEEPSGSQATDRPSVKFDVRASLRLEAKKKISSKSLFCLSFGFGSRTIETSRKQLAAQLEWDETIGFDVEGEVPTRLVCSVIRWESKKSFLMGSCVVLIEKIEELICFAVDDVRCRLDEQNLQMSADGVIATCQVWADCEVRLSAEERDLNAKKRKAFRQIEASLIAIRMRGSGFQHCRCAVMHLQASVQRRMRVVAAQRLCNCLAMTYHRTRYRSRLAGFEQLKGKFKQLAAFLARMSLIQDVLILQAHVRRFWFSLQYSYDMQCARVLQASLRSQVKRRRFLSIMKSVQIISPRVRLYVNKLTSRRGAQSASSSTARAPPAILPSHHVCVRVLQAHIRKRMAMSGWKVDPPGARRLLARSLPKFPSSPLVRQQLVETRGQSSEQMYQVQRDCAQVILAKIHARWMRRNYEQVRTGFVWLCWRLKANVYRSKHVKRVSLLVSGQFLKDRLPQNRVSALSLPLHTIKKFQEGRDGVRTKLESKLGEEQADGSTGHADLLETARELLKQDSQLLDSEAAEGEEVRKDEDNRNINDTDRGLEIDNQRHSLSSSDDADDTRVYNVLYEQKKSTQAAACEQVEWWSDYVDIVERWRSSNASSRDEVGGSIGVSLLQTRRMVKEGQTFFDLPLVQEILPGGAADVDGRLGVGDEIMA
eukprot:684881-Hanusia_phi.AAC.1